MKFKKEKSPRSTKSKSNSTRDFLRSTQIVAKKQAVLFRTEKSPEIQKIYSAVVLYARQVLKRTWSTSQVDTRWSYHKSNI